MDQAVSHSDRAARLGPGVVFVVDDDEAVRDSMRVLIESNGHEVVDFGSARDFLGWRAPGEVNACLILDNNMPDLTGIDLLESLRESGDMMPVIMVTGGPGPGLDERINRARRAVCLEKPIDPNELLDTLDDALRARAAFLPVT